MIPARTNKTILDWKAGFKTCPDARVINMPTPVITAMANAPHAHGINSLFRLEIEYIVAPMPINRRSTQKIAPTIKDAAITCTVSMVGNQLVEAMT